MGIEYKLGDLFAGPERVLVHGCNRQGVMGSGFAQTLRARHPAAYDAYRTAHRDGLQLGQVVWAESDGVRVGNAITQDGYGRDPGVIYCDYAAIQTAMRTIDRDAAGERVAMPQIGAGLAHGSWPVIAAIIAAEATHFTPIVYVLDRATYDALTSA